MNVPVHMPLLKRKGMGYLIAFLVGFLMVAGDLGLDHFGIPHDEMVYHEAAKRHVRWVKTWGGGQAVTAKTLADHFAWKPAVVIHPTFSRLASGFSWALFFKGLGVSEIVALRLHLAFFYGMGGVGILWFLWSSFGVLTGWVGLLLYFANIRFFGHAHTAQTDLVLSVLWFWATLLLLKAGKQGSHFWVLGAAGMLGLALATKITAVLLGGTLVLWMVMVRGKKAWGPVLTLTLVPMVIFIALNPQTWNPPLVWIQKMVTDLANREQAHSIATLFLGEKYLHRLPWYVPLVHGVITLPVSILFLSLAGACMGGATFFRNVRSSSLAVFRRPWTLLLVSGFSSLAMASLPSVPAHDLERLFLPLQPFLVLFASFGFWTLTRPSMLSKWVRPWPSKAMLPMMLAGLVTLPALVEALRQHPYPLTYFNFLVGGTPGAKGLGLDIAYLKIEANQQMLDALNKNVVKDGSLFTNFLNLDLRQHQKAGRLRKDIVLKNHLSKGDFLLIYARPGWMTPLENRIYQDRPPPLWALRHRDIDLLLLYRW